MKCHPMHFIAVLHAELANAQWSKLVNMLGSPLIVMRDVGDL